GGHPGGGGAARAGSPRHAVGGRPPQRPHHRTSDRGHAGIGAGAAGGGDEFDLVQRRSDLDDRAEGGGDAEAKRGAGAYVGAAHAAGVYAPGRVGGAGGAGGGGDSAGADEAGAGTGVSAPAP